VIRVVLFDIDGTLIRTYGAGTKAFERTFASEFKIPRATESLSFAGRTDTSLVREGFQLHGIEPTARNFQRFFESYVFWLDHLLQASDGAPCRGVRWRLRDFARLAQPPLIGLLTGNIRLGAEIKLRHHRLWDSFRMGAFGDDHESRNELAKIARQRASVLLERRIAGEEILVVGDTPLDIACARAINARVLAVATGGFTAAQLRPHKPDWLVENLEQIKVSEVCG
jgi:phosphoglycolate phosphatase-like HAD superfamily hydrolase